MTQPYIYTMPEGFIKDPTVPIHWKLYALINGFWIASKPVYASNAWFAEKLGCSDRYVRECLEKLESMGIIERQGKSQNRRIIPGGGAEQGGTSSSAQGGTSSSGREEPAVPHISDSISDSITLSDSDESEVVPVDEDGNPLSKKKNKNTPEMRAVYAIFSDNPAYKTWHLQSIQRDATKTLLETMSLEDIRHNYELVKKRRHEDKCPQIYSPLDMLNKSKQMEYFLKNN